MLDNTNDPHLDMIRNKFFKESLMGIVIFGAPAFCAVILGKYLESLYGGDRKIILLSLLLIAFTSSWVVIYLRNKRITKEYREYRSLQKSMSEKETQTNTVSPADPSVLNDTYDN